MTGDEGDDWQHPYVDRPVTDLAAADRAAERARRRWGLDELERLRVGMNAIYASGDVVLRVGAPTVDAGWSLRLAEMLHARGLRVARPMRPDACHSGGLQVTCWERVHPVDVPIDWHGVGALVRRVHAIEPAAVPAGYPLPSPARFPWWDFDALLAATADAIAPAPLAGLRRAVERGRGWGDFDGAHGTVLCHGDVHPGNVLMVADGPLLLDWDLLCRAPVGWDHAPMMTWGERWGGDGDEYARFAEGYGRSLRGDPRAETLAELRLVAATLMRVRAGLTDPVAAEEAARRLRYWAGDSDAPAWRAQ